MTATEFSTVWLWVIATYFFGAIWGSFVNAAAHRLPRGISMWSRSRSFCPSCEHQLAWYDNVPMLSYLTLLGRCRYCRKPIGSRYIWTEILVSSLFLFAGYQFFAVNHALTWFLVSNYWRMRPEIFFMQLFLIVDLVLLSVVDLETWLIPAETTLLWIPVGFLLGAFFPELHPSATEWYAGMPWLNAIIDSFQGMVLGAGVLWTVGFMTTLITFCFYRLRGLNERPKEGMGGGDVHLLAMVGAVLGWKPALATIFIGIMLGCVSGVSKILWDKYQQRRLGDKWRPWQPTYELPPETGAPQAPSFWPLAVMGIVIVIAVVILSDRSALTFNGFFQPTSEEVTQLQSHTSAFHEGRVFDARMVPMYLMGAIGGLLIVAFPFMTWLAKMDMLPQGSIVEQPDGEKQEVLQGNYVPFGPSLAAAAIFVVFYDPLIRNLAFWFAMGSSGHPALTPYELVGDGFIRTVVEGAVNHLNQFTAWLLSIL